MTDPVTPPVSDEMVHAVLDALAWDYGFTGDNSEGAMIRASYRATALDVVAAVRPLIEAEALTAFEAKLGQAIELTEAIVSDRKIKACQVVGLRAAKLMAIEAADKAQRGEQW